ncbi:MAG TPA: LysR substrate-binding domain-containing protein [Casimicrobiaceae bacterium]|nr:LysR substrate-binding domain-containing protein [Casimicrobiaceae bacterium]
MHSLRRKLPSANALFAFEAAARCGNFSKAALELYVTQPAVSRMLSRMEQHLSVKLFERAHAKVRLTEDGEILFARISEGFRGIEAALDEIEARRTGTETITLSVSTAFTTHWLMPRMHKLRTAFPGVDVRFQLTSGPLRGPVKDVDLGLRFPHRDEVHEHGVLLMPEILVPVCSPGYARNVRSRAKDGDTLMNLTDGDRDWHRRFASFRKNGRPLARIVDFSDYAIVIQAALLGQGIALGWLNSVAYWLSTGALVPGEREAVVTERACRLLHSSDRPPRFVVVAVREWIAEEMRSDLRAVDRMYPELQLAKLAGCAPASVA